MPDGVYERDALAWAEQQSALLRRLAAGERAAESIDWPRVIEEIEDVGLSELRACRSLTVQALVHLLKICAWSNSDAVAHWRGEAASFLAAARRSFTPSMRQRIVLTELYDDALYQVRAGAMKTGTPDPLPEACPFSLDDLLTGRPDVNELVARLATAN